VYVMYVTLTTGRRTTPSGSPTLPLYHMRGVWGLWGSFATLARPDASTDGPGGGRRSAPQIVGKEVAVGGEILPLGSGRVHLRELAACRSPTPLEERIRGRYALVRHVEAVYHAGQLRNCTRHT
jgi:hypothetical protein